MAYLQVRNGWFHLRWRDSNGKQQSKALKTKSRRVAKRALAEWELGSAVVGEKINLGAAYSRFLAEKSGTVAEATMKNYRGLEGILKPLSGRRLDTITPSDWQRFFGDLVEQGYSPRTVNVKRNLVSGFYTWAERVGVFSPNPIRKTEPMKVGRQPVRTINPEQAEILIKHTSPEFRVAVAITYLSGVRIGELRGLTWSDFSSRGRWLRINKTVYRNGRTAIRQTSEPFTPTKSARGERIIPLSDLALSVLLEWRNTRKQREHHNRWDLIFPNFDGEVLTEHRFREALSDASELARNEWNRKNEDTPNFEPFPMKITPHILRHGTARAWVASGLTLPEVMYLMGHSNIEQTRIYSEWAIQDDTRAGRLQSAYLGGDFGSNWGL